MENFFEFNNAARGASHQSYDWLGTLSKLVYRLELLGAFVFLCCLVYCIPIAAEFLRRVSAFVSAPPFVFVFFNAVIVVIALSVKFGVFSGADNVSARENVGIDEEEVQQQLLPEEILPGNEDDPGKSFFQVFNNTKDESSLEKNLVIEDKEVILCEEKSTPTPTTTRTPIRDTYQGGVANEDKYEFEYENKNESENEDENPVDELSCEEFNKKIESFIEDMRTFRRQEYWLESLKENNRTSIAVFD